MVAYPGFGKTYFLKQLLDKKSYSFFKDTSVKCRFFSGDTTGPHFKGKKYVDPEGNVVEEIGFAHPDREGRSIIGMEEFSTITNSFKQTYNANLDNAILTALDDGKVDSGRAAGEISFETYLTVWAGVQPQRLDISSGFSRRFIFTAFFPTIKDIEYFRSMRRQSFGVKIDLTALKNIRIAINQRKKEIDENLKYISFSQDFYDTLNKFNQMHYDDELMERLALGYWLMRSERIQDQLYVRMEPELERLLYLLKHYEQTVRDFQPAKIVMKLLSSEKEVEKAKLFEYGYKLGLTMQQMQGALAYWQNIKKRIKVEGYKILVLENQD